MSNGLYPSISRFMGSPAFKLGLITFIVLLLIIPPFFIMDMVATRDMRSRNVASEVAQSWGGPQSFAGPVLIVPFTVRPQPLPPGAVTEPPRPAPDQFAIFLPDQLDIKAKAKSQVLHRAIYEVPVFSTDLAVAGRFSAPDMGLIAGDITAVRWNDAVFALAVPELRGLKQASNLKVSGRGEAGFEPSLGLTANIGSGLHVRLADLKGGAPGILAPLSSAPLAFDFDFTVRFTGSGSLNFGPAGRETTVSLASDWPSPSFNGSFLPEERSVDTTGFTANWRVPHLARSVPQVWVATGPDINLAPLMNYQFGVNLTIPVDFYDLVIRAIRYASMFTIGSFMAVFIMEALSAQRLHPVQYVFTGAALLMFFVLLLSLAEHIGFGPAYWLSALATSLLIAGYVWRAMGSAAKGGIMLAVLLILYGLLYLILRLEDYALLAGAIAGFVMLAAAMFLTLGIDWSGRKTVAAPAAK